MSIKLGFGRTSDSILRGYVAGIKDITDVKAKQATTSALVIMVVSLDEHWKMPLGYFATTSVDTPTLVGIINESLDRLHDVGVKFVSLTLDGPTSHFSSMKTLGASFDLDDPRPYFIHKKSGSKVRVIFDACHMLKLHRNHFGQLKELKDGRGRLIKWDYIEKWVELQEKEGLRAANKLRRRHLQYWEAKMKVSLAAQTLSSGVADALHFCDKSLQLPQFQGSEATIDFIRCIDRSFDFLNSRQPNGTGTKSPLRACNESFWRPRVLTDMAYLKGITNTSGKPMSKTPQKVPFVGLVTAMEAVIGIFDDFVKPDNSQLKFLLTYKLSQDHIELFFCAIRRCGGWCPNPTSGQFLSAYRRLLVRHEVQACNGNVEAMDNTTILCTPSTVNRRNKPDVYELSSHDAADNKVVAEKYGLSRKGRNEDSDDEDILNEFLDFHASVPENLSDFSKNVVGYMGGFVVRKLLNADRPIIKCMACAESLCEKCNAEHHPENALVGVRNRGGLIFPSESVLAICKRADELFRVANNKNSNRPICEKNFPAVLCSSVETDLFANSAECTLFPSLLETHCTREEACAHRHSLCKNVCKLYIKTRLFTSTKEATELLLGCKVRHSLSRQIIWKNQ